MDNRTGASSVRAIAQEIVQTCHDLSQYLAHQGEMGNTRFEISEEAWQIVNTWGRPEWGQPPFVRHGPDQARFLFVDSDATFFNGKAGELLKKILNAMNLDEGQVCICNATDPAGIRAWVRASRPAMIITLGEKAGQAILEQKTPIARFRGRFHVYSGIRVMPTLHPSDLLLNPGLKRQVWTDMQEVMAVCGLAHGT